MSEENHFKRIYAQQAEGYDALIRCHDMVPHHRHYESDLEPILAGEPFELTFDLLATSCLFRAGNRIRVTIAFADADNFDTPVLDPPPTLKLLRNTSFPTYIELPVVHNP